MRTTFTLIGLLCLFLGTARPLTAQKSRPIDWMPEENTGQRYTVSVHPYHLMKSGLKFDFEKQLSQKNKWLQIGLMGYYTPRDDEYGWESLASGYAIYNKLAGGGVSIAYKTMLSRNGFHYNFGFLYNLYNVNYDDIRYVSFTEDDLVFYERKLLDINKTFHQPAVFIHVGKHMALSRHVFLDMFMGLGYMHSFHSGRRIYDDYCGFGYRGAYFNGGLRIGVVWGNKTK